VAWRTNGGAARDEGAEPMDEFGWERFLRASDARLERYRVLLEKYRERGRAEAERLATREMGWSQFEADEQAGALDGQILDGAEPQPNPDGEGVSWIRMANGGVAHPLAYKAYLTGFEFRRDCARGGLLHETGAGTAEELCASIHATAIKLAGALNHVAYSSAPEQGFVVAYLKRALKPLHESLRQADHLRAQGLFAPQRMNRLRNDLLALREDILRLMRHYRR
jgi:hypothetical protein